MKKVLFVCTGNTCRSPMAMALFNFMAEKRNINNIYVADSAGFNAFNEPINSKAVEALKTEGIIFTEYYSKKLTLEMLKSAYLVVVMNKNAEEYLKQLGFEKKTLVLSNGINDPYGGKLEDYISCLKEIKQGIQQLFSGGYIEC